jgi:HEAT repeat protein
MTAPPLLSYNPDTLDPIAAALLPRLSDTDPVVRRIALLELADLEDPALVPALVYALKYDAAADVRREAAIVLAAWEGEEEVVELLCSALLDTDETVRLAAAQSLSELKEPASGPGLEPWAAHADFFVQASVLRALRELRYPGAFDVALRSLSSEQAAVRFEAVGVLGWLKDERALSSMAMLARSDTDDEVRRGAIGALGFATSDHATALSSLLAALADTAWQVREEAATTLGKLRATGALQALVTALDDPYWQVRVRAARSLGKLGDKEAAPALALALTHSISNLRKEAALSLGELRDARTLAALQAAQDDRDPDVRKAVRVALQQIGDVAS